MNDAFKKWSSVNGQVIPLDKMRAVSVRRGRPPIRFAKWSQGLPIEIRKYRNRKLYAHGKYVALKDVVEWVREGHAIKVTYYGEDCTSKLLKAIIIQAVKQTEISNEEAIRMIQNRQRQNLLLKEI